MSYCYYVGLDLGQAADHSALAIVEEPIWAPADQRWVSSSTLTPEVVETRIWQRWQAHRPSKPPLWLRTLHRYPLRTPYPDIVADVVRRFGTEERNDAVLVIDGTGVGAAVVDMFRDSALSCDFYPVIITGGVKVERNHVPKRDLIGAVQVAIQTGRLETTAHTKDVETFMTEMQHYAIKLTDTGHDTYNARGDSQHDDLVLAVALACWYRGRLNRGE